MRFILILICPFALDADAGFDLKKTLEKAVEKATERKVRHETGKGVERAIDGLSKGGFSRDESLKTPAPLSGAHSVQLKIESIDYTLSHLSSCNFNSPTAESCWAYRQR